MRVKNKWMVQIAPKPGVLPDDSPQNNPIDVYVEAYWDVDHELTLESVIDAARWGQWWKIYSTTGLKCPFMPVAEPVLIPASS